MPERKYVEVGGKKYPLKTDAERAASKNNGNTSANSGNSGDSGSRVSVPVPSPGSGARQVLIALSLAVVIFAAAGGKIEKVIAKARRQPEPQTDKPVTVQTIAGWAVIFVTLMALADFSATSDLAVAFAYLLLISVLLEFGPKAFDNLTNIVSQSGSNTTIIAPPNVGRSAGGSF